MSALCYVREGMFVSGSGDKSHIIWNKLPEGSTCYSHSYILTGHKSNIMGITRMSNTDIISWEWEGDLRIWNIDQGICTRQIHSLDYTSLTHMKQYKGEVAINYMKKIRIWGASNNFLSP